MIRVSSAFLFSWAGPGEWAEQGAAIFDSWRAAAEAVVVPAIFDPSLLLAAEAVVAQGYPAAQLLQEGPEVLVAVQVPSVIPGLEATFFHWNPACSGSWKQANRVKKP